MSSIEFTVEPREAGKRLDRLLVERVDGMTRQKARDLIEGGHVRLNGRRVEKSYTVEASDRIVVQDVNAIPSKHFAALPNPNLSVDIRHEDEDVVVVNKPAGMPTHPLKPGEITALANALVARYPEMQGVGYSAREPGIVHRLDNDTSGLLIAARNAESFAALRSALQNGKITKRYLALVEGWVTAPRKIELALAQHPKDKRRVVACLPGQTRGIASRAAETVIEKGETIGTMTLVELSASPALRHQVRVHLATIGHPLAGDRLYGGPAVPDLERHFLHASYVSFEQPRTGAVITVRSDLPDELQRVLQQERKA